MIKSFEAPQSDSVFVKYWDLFINDVTERDNFKLGHLEQLQILCNLYKEYHMLTEQINEEGFTYHTDPEGNSRYGNQIKPNPACTLRDKTLMEIRQYSKLLGLVLEKDKKITKEEESKSDWE